MSWLNIDNKVYIVTGGSSGIGKAIVEALLEQNCIVVNADISEVEQNNKNYRFFKTDISFDEDIRNLVEFTIQNFKKIDGVVNNAGINIPRLLVDYKKEESEFELSSDIYDKIMNINLKGVYMLSQKCAKVFIKQGYGVVLNMSSESGLEGSEGQGCYAASKAALNSFTRSWAKELGKKNIRVVGVAPGILEETGLRTLAYEEALAYTRNKTVDDLRKGYSNTSTIPLSRSGKLSEVADLVMYLLSQRASYITGVTINIAGGKTRG
ncbi:sorbitol-6-phosphate 2-dehydrogenase [Spiroplasma helicoides]|uniref:Sorbitol-6-phosphate 2-dehydrogenase n=1 Tax=Spiroplasma helicoides TaxID=216938 RepID=A0A1B3SLT3_9MOLU|nr:SDR family oxidoreductase [Spiroplasma helicoides]AOG60877.1 sorbitol-6-phosphate 2-dehydrogenase [Spiroplasma helicoides]